MRVKPWGNWAFCCDCDKWWPSASNMSSPTKRLLRSNSAGSV